MRTSSKTSEDIQYEGGGRTASFYDYLINSLEQGGGLKGSRDRYPKGKNKSKAYPMVSSSNFAGGGRSYPIPTRADAVDALRLAGMHGRSDVRSKVYAKYPDLKKQEGGSLSRGRTYNIGGFNYGRVTSPMSNPEIPIKNPVNEDKDLDTKSRETGSRNMLLHSKNKCGGPLMYKCRGGRLKP